MRIKKEVFFFWAKVFVVGLFVMLVASQAGKSFVLDEIDFPTVAHTTSQTGRPIYYHSEQNPNQLGTYHPTLYINLLALFIRIFGFNAMTVRFFGAICVLSSALFLLLIYRQLSKKNDGLETLFLGIYLLNPYTLSNATLPDIDSTILPVLLLGYLYFSIKLLFRKNPFNNRTVLMLGLLYAVVLWSKLTTPLIIPPVLLCMAYITSKNLKDSLWFMLKVSSLGIITFVATYFLYCALLGLSLTYTYTFLLASFTKGTTTEGPIIGALHNLENIRYFVYWLTIPLLGIVSISVLSLFFTKSKNEKDRIKKLLVAISLVVTIFYIALLSPFGGYFKYPFPVFGLLLLSVIFLVERYLTKTKLHALYMIIAVIVGYLVEKIHWKDSMFLSGKPLDYRYLFLIAMLAIIIYVLLTKARTRGYASIFVAISIFFAVGYQLSISRIQAIAPYPTKYLYGQTGIDDAAAYLRLNTKPNEVIWSMKDVGYYSNRRFYESYAYYFDRSLEKDLISKLKGGQVRYYVATTGIGQDNLDYYVNVKDILNTYAVRDKQFGNYVIYKAKE